MVKLALLPFTGMKGKCEIYIPDTLYIQNYSIRLPLGVTRSGSKFKLSISMDREARVWFIDISKLDCWMRRVVSPFRKTREVDGA